MSLSGNVSYHLEKAWGCEHDTLIRNPNRARRACRLVRDLDAAASKSERPMDRWEYKVEVTRKSPIWLVVLPRTSIFKKN